MTENNNNGRKPQSCGTVIPQRDFHSVESKTPVNTGFPSGFPSRYAHPRASAPAPPRIRARKQGECEFCKFLFVDPYSKWFCQRWDCYCDNVYPDQKAKCP